MDTASQLSRLEVPGRGGIVQQAKLARMPVELVREPVGRKPEGEGETARESAGKVFEGEEVRLHGRLEGG